MPISRAPTNNESNLARAQIHVVNQRKQDLERRLKVANSDKSNLNAALDEAGDKILLLEGLIGERDSKLAELLEELSELRDSSSWLSNELESMISLNERLASLQQQQQDSGQQNELASQTKRSQLIESLRELKLKSRIRQRASERLMERRRELVNPSETNGSVSGGLMRQQRRVSAQRAVVKRKRKPASSLFDELENETSEVELEDELGLEMELEDGEQVKLTEQLALELFTLLRQFQLTLQQRKDTFTSLSKPQQQLQQQQQQLFSPNSADDSGISADDCKCCSLPRRLSPQLVSSRRN